VGRYPAFKVYLVYALAPIYETVRHNISEDCNTTSFHEFKILNLR